jgi:8-oxo-dGTP diphosphatase
MIKVVCGVIWKEDKIFIARRKPEKSQGGYWEFPGGKIEDAEIPEIALQRELKEEFDMQVNIGIYIGKNIHHYENITVELIAYTCGFISASFLLTDHDKYEFVNPIELRNYKMAPADLFLVEILNTH